MLAAYKRLLDRYYALLALPQGDEREAKRMELVAGMGLAWTKMTNGQRRAAEEYSERLYNHVQM